MKGFFTFPCALESNIDVGIAFAGKRFSIDIQDFNLGRAFADSSDCVGGILSFDDASGIPINLAIVGDEFLKSCESECPQMAFNFTKSRGERVCNFRLYSGWENRVIQEHKLVQERRM
jgi:hypothetical protein